jgi:DNA-binding SARP family transcriptional activator
MAKKTPVNTAQTKLKSPIGLVFPHNEQRNRLIAEYLDQPASAYYSLQVEDTSGVQLTANILASLDEQGFEIRKTRAGNDDSEAGRALGAALGGIQVLVLDQFDRFEGDPSAWLNAIVEAMPGSSRLVISARSLYTTPWNPLLQSGAVSLLGSPESLGHHILDGEPRRLEVYALGLGSVWFEGRAVTHWDGPLTRRLFYFLLDRGPVSRTTIFETFWPNLPVREATNVFHVTKRKMNETIGMDVTDYIDRHYRVGAGVRLYYDVAEFESALKQADLGSGQESENGWQRAIQLYRHNFLMHETASWAVLRRDELRDGYAQALVSMARVYQHRGEIDMALNHFLRAIREVPMREDLHHNVMKLYAEKGDRVAAIDQYERLRKRLADTLGIPPAKESTTLYHKLTK